MTLRWNEPKTIVRIMGTLTLLYGLSMTVLSVAGIRFFASGLFEDVPKLIIVAILLGLNLLCFICGIGIVLLKPWALKILFFVSLTILLDFAILLVVGGMAINVLAIIFVVLPIFFIYIFNRKTIRSQFISTH